MTRVTVKRYAVKIGNPGKTVVKPFHPSDNERRVLHPERYLADTDFTDAFTNYSTAEYIADEINRRFPGVNARVKTVTRRVWRATRESDWYEG